METRTESSNRPTTAANTHLSAGDTNKQQQSQQQGNNKQQQQQGDGATGVIKQAKDTLNQSVDKVTKSTGEFYDSAIQYSKKNPGAAIGIALASGATL